MYLDTEMQRRSGSRRVSSNSTRMIVATEQSVEAEKEYNESLKEVKEFNEEHDGNFPGSFLKWKDDKIQSNLKDLVNLIFGEIEYEKHTR